ncbi:MAG: patatin [Cellulosilyticum sp.]|nr:patatin [Cellulosilyticum sp.]
MSLTYKNLVFSGGGVLGIAYLGTLDYFYKNNLVYPVARVAGTSAGAITACLTAFNLPFSELSAALDSLDYKKILDKEDNPETPKEFSSAFKEQFSRIFDNIDCVYRLIKKYGWYSSQYFYNWIKLQIASQFDSIKKPPPYTFADFQNPSIHKDNRIFKDLYIVGTNVSRSSSIIFSYNTTPDMEVAEAVRISMSVPLLFESVKSDCISTKNEPPYIFIDGGMLYNYPINLFDDISPLDETLGIYFNSTPPPATIKNLVDFISCALSCSGSVQNALFASKPENIARSICIYTGDISSLDFNITTGDSTYNFLYEQGYRAAEVYFSLLLNN